MSLNVGTGFTLLEGGALVGEEDAAVIDLAAGRHVHLDLGSAVISGGRYVAGSDPQITGPGAVLSIRTPGELLIGAVVTSAGTMTLESGEVQDDLAEYFDSLPGVTLSSTADADAVGRILGALSGGGIAADLQALLQAAGLDVQGTLVAVAAGDFRPWGDLRPAQQLQVARSLGYQVFADGAFWNEETGVIREQLIAGSTVGYDPRDIAWGAAGRPEPGTPFGGLTAQQQAVVAAQLGYTVFGDGVYFKAGADVPVRTGFVQGISADYDNAQIDWAAAGARPPSGDPGFAQLNSSQKMAVADSIGYRFDYASIGTEQWIAGVGFDYSTVAREVWIASSTANFSVLIDAQTWGSVPKPAPGAAYADLSAAQREIVDANFRFEPDLAPPTPT
jgi:hypothetical protein